MSLLKLVFVFTALVVSTSIAANSLKTKTSSDKRVIKAGLVSKSKFKSIIAPSKKTLTAVSSDVHNQGKLSTQLDFNDLLVGGKYQSPMEALSVVEDEKSIDDLIGVRKNFQDREQRAKAMR